jgi:hypothetical protein
MRKAIAVGMLGLALVSNRAAAQTAVEQAQILRDFQEHVVDYTQRHRCLNMWPEAINAATPAPKVFTLPVAMVFRQLIATAVNVRSGALMIGGVGATQHAAVLQPFPANELYDFPQVLADALPGLPAPLEYRLIENDLVIRDGNADLIVAVLRDALGTHTTRR